MNKIITLQKGFTIVELLIVIVVIGILAAITVVGFNGVSSSAHDASVKSDLQQIQKKLQSFYVETGAYPQTEAQLATLDLKASKASYGRHVNATMGTYNLLYCRPQTDPTRIALIASSVSGNLYRLTNGSLTTISRTSWDTANVASATLCTNAGIPTSTAQVWFRGESVWKTWVGGSV